MSTGGARTCLRSAREESAERSEQEADAHRDERQHLSEPLSGGSEEEAEDEAGRGCVDEEVVPLDRRADDVAKTTRRRSVDVAIVPVGVNPTGWFVDALMG
jgi:hypothetical protein